jgi:hypothetical protein
MVPSPLEGKVCTTGAGGYTRGGSRATVGATPSLGRAAHAVAARARDLRPSDMWTGASLPKGEVRTIVAKVCARIGAASALGLGGASSNGWSQGPMPAGDVDGAMPDRDGVETVPARVGAAPTPGMVLSPPELGPRPRRGREARQWNSTTREVADENRT